VKRFKLFSVKGKNSTGTARNLYLFSRDRPDGVMVSILATGPKICGYGFFKGDKNPHHTFLRMGSKAGGPMSLDFTACKNHLQV
jgi:hypothetical protein